MAYRRTSAAAISVTVCLAACGGNGDLGGSATTAEPAPTAPTTTAPAPVASAPSETPLTTNDDSLLNEPTWAVLFAGHDLMSFNAVGGGNWRIADGLAQADGGETPSFLVTKGAYTDFRIRVEFQASSETNSGVFIRCEDPIDISAERCYEVNIFDHNQNENNRTAAIVNVAPPATAVMAGDAWNTLDITAEGDHLVVRFNDTVTVDARDGTHARGYVGLQYNGGPIKFRRVTLRPL